MKRGDKQLRRRVRRSYVVSTVSVALVLFLLGSVGYMLTAASQTAHTLKESLTMIVELKSDITEDEKFALHERLIESPAVVDVTFSAKEDKLSDEEFRKMLAVDIEDILQDNPLLDSYDVRLATDSDDEVAIAKFVAELQEVAGVEHVSYPETVMRQMHSVIAKIRLLLLLFGGALLVVSFILLYNTIRLAIFAKRYIINTMKLVGATKWFIMRPFLYSALKQGIAAGVAATALFVALVYGMGYEVPEITAAVTMRHICTISGAMIATGIAVSVLFTIFAVNKFVNIKSNKIHLY